MNPEIGRIIGMAKKSQLTIYVNGKGELKCSRITGTNAEIPAEFATMLRRNADEFKAMLSGVRNDERVEQDESGPCETQCEECDQWERLYFGDPSSGTICRRFDWKNVPKVELPMTDGIREILEWNSKARKRAEEVAESHRKQKAERERKERQKEDAERDCLI